jgi:hypothetical protein
LVPHLSVPLADHNTREFTPYCLVFDHGNSAMTIEERERDPPVKILGKPD